MSAVADPTTAKAAVTFVRMSSCQNGLYPLRPHPHAGARDAEGNCAYVADVTLVRRWMIDRFRHRGATATSTGESQDSIGQRSLRQFLPFDDENEMKAICGTFPGEGSEGTAGFQLLTEHIRVENSEIEDLIQSDLELHQQEKNSQESIIGTFFYRAHTLSASRKFKPRKNSKILCVVYTYKGKNEFLQGIIETWGWRCDGFFAASTETLTSANETHFDTGVGAVDLPHLGGESYNTMWQKTRSIVGYLYDNYRDEYDYFLNCGDDTYAIVDNLRIYLRSVESRYIQQNSVNGTAVIPPLLLGHHVVRGREWYVGGGPGYVFNRAALSLFVEFNLKTCLADQLKSAEDRFISRCMRDAGVILADTADIEGRQRFVGVPANTIATENPWETRSWMLGMYEHWNKQGHGQRWGRNVTSTGVVSFHKIVGRQNMKRLHAILYNSCPRGSILGEYLALNITNKRPLILREGRKTTFGSQHVYDFTSSFEWLWRFAGMIFLTLNLLLKRRRMVRTNW